jgi:hippurate hydrolase
MSGERISAEWITEAIAWRRHLHQHPELAFHENRTADFVAAQLGRFGLTVHRGLAGTGVVGTLSRGTSRRRIGIRADMDALPIQEQSGIEYASRVPGVMHACGHDGHVAIALAAARACAGLSSLDGTVHFIFQPAEENEGGGRRMIEDGLFRLFPCDAVYALHNWPALPLGTCVARDGPMMAALGTFEITVAGRGCHAAMPHEGADAILASSYLVAALQSVVSRNVDPLQASVISATQIHAGSTWNVTPDHCIVRGTTRWFDAKLGDVLERRIGELCEAIPVGFGCTAKLAYQRRFPATINNADVARFVRDVASAYDPNLKVIDCAPSMASEDFAFMLQEARGCYLWLGAGKGKEGSVLHSPRYNFNDEALQLGVNLWVSVVLRSLQ